MTHLRAHILAWLVLIWAVPAQAQLLIAFDPCPPGADEESCANELHDARILIRGASADTHDALIGLFTLESLLALTPELLEGKRDALASTDLYDDIAIDLTEESLIIHHC